MRAIRYYWIVFIIFSLIGRRLYYVSDSYQFAQVIYSLAQHGEVLFLLLTIFFIVPYKYIATKFVTLNLLIYQVVTVVVYIIVQNHSLHAFGQVELLHEWGDTLNKAAAGRMGSAVGWVEWAAAPAIFIANYILFTEAMLRYRVTSDELNNTNIFLYITKPKNIISLILIIFKRTPISGVLLYANNCIYCFKKGNTRLQKLNRSVLVDKRKYLILDTGKKIADYQTEIDNLEQTQWSLRNNCISVFSRTFNIDIFNLIKQRSRYVPC